MAIVEQARDDWLQKRAERLQQGIGGDNHPRAFGMTMSYGYHGSREPHESLSDVAAATHRRMQQELTRVCQ